MHGPQPPALPRVPCSANRCGQVRETALSEKLVWQLIRPCAEATGVPGIAPHDCRRTRAKLCRAAGGELEQIQMLLGHQFRPGNGTLSGHEAGSGEHTK